jgi:hypothetical protein
MDQHGPRNTVGRVIYRRPEAPDGVAQQTPRIAPDGKIYHVAGGYRVYEITPDGKVTIAVDARNGDGVTFGPLDVRQQRAVVGVRQFLTSDRLGSS